VQVDGGGPLNQGATLVYEFPLVAYELSSSTASVLDTGPNNYLRPAEPRSYRVRAWNTYGYGPWSDQFNISTTPDAPMLESAIAIK
jgi:hypothetical protein